MTRLRSGSGTSPVSASVRERDLPAHVVVYYVIALALYMRSSYREVLRCLLEGVQWLLDPSVTVKVAGKSGTAEFGTRDKKGRLVTDLQPGEVEVLEDGVPQKVEQMKFVRLTGQRPDGDETSLEIRSQEQAEAEWKSKLETYEKSKKTLRVKDFDEAIALANDSSYGLAASLYTENVHTAHRVARALKAGTVSVNCYSEGDITTPFGGFKQSGFAGRDKSIWAHEQYTELKTIWMQLA